VVGLPWPPDRSQLQLWRLGRRNDLRPRTLASPRRYRAATAATSLVPRSVAAHLISGPLRLAVLCLRRSTGVRGIGGGGSAPEVGSARVGERAVQARTVVLTPGILPGRLNLTSSLTWTLPWPMVL